MGPGPISLAPSPGRVPLREDTCYQSKCENQSQAHGESSFWILLDSFGFFWILLDPRFVRSACDLIFW